MKSNAERMGYLISKLEELHADIIEMKADIDNLRKDSVSYGVASKIMLVLGGLLTPVFTWFVSQHFK